MKQLEVNNLRDQIETLEKEAKSLLDKSNARMKDLAELPPIPEPIDISELREQQRQHRGQSGEHSPSEAGLEGSLFAGHTRGFLSRRGLAI